MSARRFSCWARLRRRAHAGGWLRLGAGPSRAEQVQGRRCGETFPVFKAKRIPGCHSRWSSAVRGVSSRCLRRFAIRVLTSVFMALRRVLGSMFGASRRLGAHGDVCGAPMSARFGAVAIRHQGAHLGGCWLLEGSRFGVLGCSMPGCSVSVGKGSSTWRRHLRPGLRAACSLKAGCGGRP